MYMVEVNRQTKQREEVIVDTNNFMTTLASCVSMSRETFTDFLADGEKLQNVIIIDIVYGSFGGDVKKESAHQRLDDLNNNIPIIIEFDESIVGIGTNLNDINAKLLTYL